MRNGVRGSFKIGHLRSQGGVPITSNRRQQVVIKSLEENYTRVTGVSGATILGDGTVAMIVDVVGLINLAGNDVLAASKAVSAEVVA